MLKTFIEVNRWRTPVAMLFIALFWAIGVAFATPQIRAFADHPPEFDEAVHLLPLAQIVTDLRDGQWSALWQHSYEQDELALYPFLHSWLAAPLMLFTGADLTGLRVAGLTFVGLSAVTAFLIGRALAVSTQWPNLTGVLAGLLTLTCLPLWVYASVVFLEGAGLWLVLLCLWSYTCAGEDETHLIWLVAASGFAVGAFFIKYSFGVLAAGGLVGAELLILVTTRRLAWQRWLALGLPFGILVGLWFSLPGKWARFVVYSQSQAPTFEFWSADNWLFYVRSLMFHYLGSPGMGLLVVISGIGAVRRPAWRGPLCFMLVGLAILTVVVPQKSVRFTYTVLPVLFPLIAVAFTASLAWLSTQVTSRRGYWLLLLVATLVGGNEARLIANRVNYYPAALELTYSCSPDTGTAYRFIIDNSLVQGSRPHLFNSWHLFTHYGVTWQYYSTFGGQPGDFQYQLATTSYAQDPTPENLAQILASLHRQGVTVLVTIDGSPAGNYTGWQVIEPLWKEGHVELLTSSPHYDVVNWSHDYQLRVFAADFDDETDWSQAREMARSKFSIQLHLYRLIVK